MSSQPTIPHQPVTSEFQSNSIISKPEKTHRKKIHKNKTHRKKHRKNGDSAHKLDSMSFKPTVISNIKDSYSSIAFGKAEWEKYFGDVGIEPPLPENIEEMLNEPCFFWPNKKVEETHLLVLIPNTVNGKPFTMNYLGELIQKPKSRHSTKYMNYSNYAKEAVGDRAYPSHWVLITGDIVPGSKFGHYSKCCQLITEHSKKTGIPYELPSLLEATTSILMHYVKTGEKLYATRLYGDYPHYVYSQDFDKHNNSLVVGGFVLGGLKVFDSFSVHVYGAVACLKF